MGLTTLTEREKHWRRRAEKALTEGETWEPCSECLQYHPEGYDGACDDIQNRLPGYPSEFAG